MASSNTGTIVAVSVVGVGVLGVVIYLAMKGKAATPPVTTKPITPLKNPYAPSNYSPYNNQCTGGYVPQQPASKDAWWQNPLGQVGGNLANKLIDSIFKTGASSSGLGDLGGGDSIDSGTQEDLTALYGFTGVPYGK